MKKKFIVVGGHGFDHEMASRSMEVEADSPEEAVKLATKWPGEISAKVFGADRCWWANDEPDRDNVALTVIRLDGP